jgi:hypothetical protein
VSYLAELDQSGFEQRNADDLRQQSAPAQEGPGFFRGILKGPATGLMRGLANLNDALLTGTDLVVPMTDEERGQQERLRHSLTDFFTPDARTVGTAGRVLGGVAESVAPLLIPEVGVPLMVGSNTLAAGKRAVDQGVDATTAGSMAAIEGAASAAGVKVPILGNTLVQRLATGAAGNLALGAGSTEAQHVLLNSRGYEDLAKNYDPLDGEARAVDLLSGLVFGGLHHVTLPSEKAAVATLNNAKHFDKDTAPGVPTDPEASAAHQRAMETATEQLVRGEPVNVPDNVTRASFEPRPDAGNPIPEELQQLDTAQRSLIDKSAAQDQTGGYDVAEGVLTDEQLKQFQGLRSDVQGGEDVRGSREGTPGQSGDSNDGGARGEPLRVYRGAARELGPEDFGEGALGHATGHPSSGLGVFFTNAADRAAQYGQVSEHHLDVRNPKIIPVDELPGFDSLASAAAYRAKLMAEGHDGIVIDATHLGGPVDYVAFKPEQVLEAKKTATTSDARLADPQVRDAIEQLRGDIGLAERGGRLIRDAEGNASGRTSHIGSPLWMDRPGSAEGKGITAKSALSALDRVRDGKPLGAKQQEFVRYALDELDSVKGATEDFVNDAAREAGAEDPHVTAARELLGEHDVNIPTGELDADGNAVTRSAREMMAEADAEVATAAETGQGIAAAVSCFLTRGA